MRLHFTQRHKLFYSAFAKIDPLETHGVYAKMKIHGNKIYLRFIIYFLIFGIIVSITTSLINYNVRFNNIQNEIIDNATHEAKIKKLLIKNYIHEIDNHIQAITTNRLFKNYLNSPTQANREIAESFFLGVTRSNENFFQIRYLDKNGHENICIEKERNYVEPLIIAEENLQDKSNRYYFKNTALLQPNQTFVSKLDPNVERGEIEKPIRPTLRVSKAIYRDNSFDGIVIINIDMTYLLDLLGQSQFFNIYIVDKEGYFLLHADDQYSWSRYTSGSRLLHKDFPRFADSILSPNDFHSGDMNSFNISDVLPNDEYLKLLLQTKPEYKEDLEVSNYRLAVFIALLIIAISIPTGLILAFSPHNSKRSSTKPSKKT